MVSEMKKLICLLLLILILVPGAASCGESKEPDVTPDTTGTADTEPVMTNCDAVVSALGANSTVKSVDALEPPYNYDLGVECYSFVCSINGLDLEVTLCLPDDFQTKKYPAMICYPWKSLDVKGRFSYIAHFGIATFVVNKRGIGASEGFSDLGGDRDLEDLTGLVDLLNALDFIDADRIMAFAVEDMTGAVLRYVSGESEKFGGKPLCAAALVNPLHDFYTLYETADEDLKQQIRQYYTGGTPDMYSEEFDKRSPGLSAEKVDVPLYIVYFDPYEEMTVNVDVDYYEEYVDTLRSNGKDVTAVYYNTHGLDLETEYQESAMVNWFLDLFD